MRAIEITGSINEKGELVLDQPINVKISGKVRVIILFTESEDELQQDSDDTPTKE